MITSQQTSLLSELRQKPIPEATFAELEARLQHRIHSLVLDAFNKSGLTQKELAERLGWDEARVSRCLGASSNWTLKTISALLAAIGVDLDDPSYTSFEEFEHRLKAESVESLAMIIAAHGDLDRVLDSREKSASLEDMASPKPLQRQPASVASQPEERKQRSQHSMLGQYLTAEQENEREAA